MPDIALSDILPGAVDLDRRLSRAIEKGRGIKLSPGELDLLAQAGGTEAIHGIAEATLKDRAKCRNEQRRRDSISAVPTGSTITPTVTARSARLSSASIGMT